MHTGVGPASSGAPTGLREQHKLAVEVGACTPAVPGPPAVGVGAVTRVLTLVARPRARLAGQGRLQRHGL